MSSEKLYALKTIQTQLANNIHQSYNEEKKRIEKIAKNVCIELEKYLTKLGLTKEEIPDLTEHILAIAGGDKRYLNRLMNLIKTRIDLKLTVNDMAPQSILERESNLDYLHSWLESFQNVAYVSHKMLLKLMNATTISMGQNLSPIEFDLSIPTTREQPKSKGGIRKRLGL